MLPWPLVQKEKVAFCVLTHLVFKMLRMRQMLLLLPCSWWEPEAKEAQ